MCHYRSYASETKAEADREKERAAKREEVVSSLLREAKMPQTTPASAKEAAPAKSE